MGGITRPVLAWPTDSSRYVTVGGPTTYSHPQARLLAIPGGGAYAVWVPNRYDSDVSQLRARRIAPDGSADARWSASGKLITVLDVSFPLDAFTAATTPDGDLIVNARALYPDPIYPGAYTRRMIVVRYHEDGSLASGWFDASQPLESPVPAGVDYSWMDSDGQGGALVSFRQNPWERRVMRLRADGSRDPAWPQSGRLLSAEPNGQKAAITPTGDGGAFMLWKEGCGPTCPSSYYYGRLTPEGDFTAVTGPSGVPLLSASENFNVTMFADGFGGAYAYWTRSLGQVNTSRVRLLRFAPDGSIAEGWPSDGVEVCSSSDREDSPSAISDGQGGAIVAWRDSRGLRSLVFATRILGDGMRDPVWPAAALPVAVTLREEGVPHLLPDGAGGFFVSWSEFPSYSPTGDPMLEDIVGQHLILSGVDPAWPAEGVAVQRALQNQYLMEMAQDGSDGALIMWNDERLSAPFVALHRIDLSRVLGEPAATVVSVDDAPNDAGGFVDLRFRASEREFSGAHRVVGYQILRAEAGGPNPLRWDASRDREWSVVAFVPASHDSLYAVRSPTSRDFGPDSVGYQAFAIDAVTSDTSFVFRSAEVVGESHPGFTGASVAAGSYHVGLAGPTPARNGVFLSTSGRSRGAVQMEALDLGGRRVARLRFDVGERLQWDLRDARGAVVAPGLYFLRVSDGDRDWVRRVIVAR